MFVPFLRMKWCFSAFSVNLMASMGTLAAIAKQRPAFMSLVVEAFESLHGETASGVNWQCRVRLKVSL